MRTPSLNAPYDRDRVLDCAARLLGAGRVGSDRRLARNLYSFLLRRNPTDPAALRGMGLCLLSAGDTVGARRCFRALPDDGAAQDAAERYFLIARSFAEERESALAVEAYGWIAHPLRLPRAVAAALWHDMGDCLVRLNRFSDASGCFDRAFPMMKDPSSLHASYGWLEYRRGNIPAAETHFRHAIRLAPRALLGHAGLGLTSFARGDLGTAARELHRAFATEPLSRSALAPLLPLAERATRRSSSRTVPASLRGRVPLPRDPAHGTLTAALQRARRAFDQRS